jgi:hypothetical protein
VELAFFYYIYVKPKILGFKSPQPRQAPRRWQKYALERKKMELYKNKFNNYRFGNF